MDFYFFKIKKKKSNSTNHEFKLKMQRRYQNTMDRAKEVRDVQFLVNCEQLVYFFKKVLYKTFCYVLHPESLLVDINFFLGYHLSRKSVFGSALENVLIFLGKKVLYVLYYSARFTIIVLDIIWSPFALISWCWNYQHGPTWRPLSFHFSKWLYFIKVISYWALRGTIVWIKYKVYSSAVYLRDHDKTGLVTLIIYAYRFAKILALEVRFILLGPIPGYLTYTEKARSRIDSALYEWFFRKKHFKPYFYDYLNKLYLNYGNDNTLDSKLSFDNFSVFSYKKVNYNLGKLMHEHQWPIGYRSYQCYNALGFFIPDVVDKLERFKMQYASMHYHNYKRSIYRNTIETRTLIFWYGMFMILPFLSAVVISRMKRPWNRGFLQRGFFRKARRLKKYKFLSFKRFRKFFTPLESRVFTLKPSFYSYKFHIFIFVCLYIFFLLFF